MKRRAAEIRRAGIVASLALALVVCQAGLASAGSWAREIPVAASGRLLVDLDFGSVRIVSHAATSARVTSEVRGPGSSEFSFELQRDGDNLRLSGRAPAWLHLTTVIPQVRVEVHIPAAYVVEVATGHGSVSVASVSGAIIRTRAGIVEVRDIRGEVDIETRDGGAVEIEGVTGEVVADTQDAPIRARFDRAPSGWLQARGGGIDVAYPTGVGAQLDARAPDGCVFVDNQLHSGCGAENRPVNLAINGGGPTLLIRAHSGDILMHAQPVPPM